MDFIIWLVIFICFFIFGLVFLLLKTRREVKSLQGELSSFRGWVVDGAASHSDVESLIHRIGNLESEQVKLTEEIALCWEDTTELKDYLCYKNLVDAMELMEWERREIDARKETE